MSSSSSSLSSVCPEREEVEGTLTSSPELQRITQDALIAFEFEISYVQPIKKKKHQREI